MFVQSSRLKCGITEGCPRDHGQKENIPRNTSRNGKEYEVINSINPRMLQNPGHTKTGELYEILRLIVQGKLQAQLCKGRRGIYRYRYSWLRSVRGYSNCSSIGIFRIAANEVGIIMVISYFL